ncbi:pro convertase subtilisin kexin type 5-like, partial [Brachionus plicatilis]
QNNQCEKCDEKCETCEFSPLNCLSCKNIIAQQYSLVFKNNYCVLNKKNDECDTGEYFDDSTSECRQCDITCNECSSSTEFSCLSCSDPRRPFLKHGQCVSVCQKGFYLNETLQKCFKCSDSCQTCSSNTSACLKCIDGFRLSEMGKCEPLVLMDSECLDKNCLQCSGNNTEKCKICKNG